MLLQFQKGQSLNTGGLKDRFIYVVTRSFLSLGCSRVGEGRETSHYFCQLGVTFSFNCENGQRGQMSNPKTKHEQP